MGFTYQLGRPLGLRAQDQCSDSSDICLLCDFGLAQEARERKNELRNEIDILLARGIHDMAFGMYSDASWRKRWLSGRVLGSGYQSNDYMGD